MFLYDNNKPNFSNTNNQVRIFCVLQEFDHQILFQTFLQISVMQHRQYKELVDDGYFILVKYASSLYKKDTLYISKLDPFNNR